MQAQREAVAVSSHGQVTAILWGQMTTRNSSASVISATVSRLRELSDEKIKAIAGSSMDPRHAHLDALLDPK